MRKILGILIPLLLAGCSGIGTLDENMQKSTAAIEENTVAVQKSTGSIQKNTSEIQTIRMPGLFIVLILPSLVIIYFLWRFEKKLDRLVKKSKK